MKALTIRQPWASLIAAGVKTIETRSWSTRYRGPLAIHAGRRWDVGWSRHALWHDPDVPSDTRDRNDVLVEKLRCDPMEDCNGSGYWTVDRYGRGHIPRGAVVATCTLADVVPIMDGRSRPIMLEERSLVVREECPPWSSASTTTAWVELGARGEKVTDQLPFGDFTPGRYAWLLTDITPCDPVPAKGRQGLWSWEAPA